MTDEEERLQKVMHKAALMEPRARDAFLGKDCKENGPKTYRELEQLAKKELDKDTEYGKIKWELVTEEHMEGLVGSLVWLGWCEMNNIPYDPTGRAN